MQCSPCVQPSGDRGQGGPVTSTSLWNTDQGRGRPATPTKLLGGDRARGRPEGDPDNARQPGSRRARQTADAFAADTGPGKAAVELGGAARRPARHPARGEVSVCATPGPRGRGATPGRVAATWCVCEIFGPHRGQGVRSPGGQGPEGEGLRGERGCEVASWGKRVRGGGGGMTHVRGRPLPGRAASRTTAAHGDHESTGAS